MEEDKFHRFLAEELVGVDLPRQFTFPFHYVPHLLCVQAACRVQEYLDVHPEWQSELSSGKMLGVLVAEKNGEIGFLAAFSGNLVGSNNHDFFVPAVYDLLAEQGFFRMGEDEITAINKRIAEELISPERKALMERITEIEREAERDISEYRAVMKASKAQRDAARDRGEDAKALIAESQFQKAELRRMQTAWRIKIEELRAQLAERDVRVSEWKKERRERSAELQERIFRHFVMLNARGESRDLCEIFANTPQQTPPAGAGECAAPKLLQYAYENGFSPLAMAEFWVGASPKDEIRRHGCFYPSCKAKCEPILGWMLQGLDVEPNPLEQSSLERNVDVLYEDEWLLAVNKPAGILSVPGKLSVDSLEERVQRLRPEIQELKVVHRLDMATSGVIVFAKTPMAYKLMQSLFAHRKVAKRYVAILDGVVENTVGVIKLPLILNPKERPLQMVNYTHGKPAVTRYEVLERKDGFTRVAFYPETGRTHQLRVHSAHPEGLNVPIKGDTLYGKSSDRLYLHAEMVEFKHPFTDKWVLISASIPF